MNKRTQSSEKKKKASFLIEYYSATGVSSDFLSKEKELPEPRVRKNLTMLSFRTENISGLKFVQMLCFIWERK